MSWEQIIIVITAAGGAVWGLVKVVFPRWMEAKIKSSEYEQTRDAARESQIFEMFGQVFEDLRNERQQDREQREKDREQMADLTNTIKELSVKDREQMVELTSTIKDLSVQLTAKMDKYSSHIRILGQETAQLADRVALFETKMGGSDRE